MYKVYSDGKNRDTDRKRAANVRKGTVKNMNNNNDGEKKTKEKSGLKKQLVSGGIYIALAAAIVTVTLGSVSKIMNGDFGYEAPDVKLEGNTGGKVVLPNIVKDETSNTEVSGVGKGVKAEVKSDGKSEGESEEKNASGNAEKNDAKDEKSDAEKPETPETPEKPAEGGTAETANEEVGEISAEYPSDPEDALFDGRFYKVADGYINREYSVEELIYSPTMKDFRTHGGVDITGDMGSPVRLFTNGTVTEIYDDTSFGKTVAVDHGNGIAALYSNLSCDLPQTTAVGAVLEGGTVIGAVGCTAATECADVSHVHLEILKDGVRIDPKAYLSSEK